MFKHPALILLLLSVLSIGGTLIHENNGTEAEAEGGRPVSFYATYVCGNLSNPVAVGGVPIAYTPNSIQFQDNFVLSLDEVPSFYLGAYGVFSVNRRTVQEYGLMDPPETDLCELLFPQKQATP